MGTKISPILSSGYSKFQAAPMFPQVNLSFPVIFHLLAQDNPPGISPHTRYPDMETGGFPLEESQYEAGPVPGRGWTSRG
jgi:hypothetical protein